LMARQASSTAPQVAYSFSGHETFTFRYTWLPKAARHLPEHPDLFVTDDAMVTLGVGKNMTKSIKYWCEAMEIIRRVDRRGHAEMETFGRNLLDPEGWDPYLEDPGTLWLLHWQLVKNPKRTSTWHLAFTRWNAERFTTDRLVNWLGRVVGNKRPRAQVTAASLRRDVEVFVRTYTPSRTPKGSLAEDTFDCPLIELGLIREEERGVYGFARGQKPTLPDEIFVYALVEFWNNVAQRQSTLSFEDIMYGAGSPGAAFRLSDNALAERLERLPTWVGLSYDDTAGLRIVLRRNRNSDGELDPTRALERYYGRGRAAMSS
jgi:hypothetical protein